MVIARRAIGTVVSGTGTTITVAYPTNAVNDMVLLIISSAGTITTPSGWTVLGNNTAQTNAHQYIFWRKVTTVLSGTQVVTSSSAAYRAVMASYSGTNGTAPLSTFKAAATSTAISTTARTFASNFALLVVTRGATGTLSAATTSTGTWTAADELESSGSPSLHILDGAVTSTVSQTLSATASATAVYVATAIDFVLGSNETLPISEPFSGTNGVSIGNSRWAQTPANTGTATYATSGALFDPGNSNSYSVNAWAIADMAPIADVDIVGNFTFNNLNEQYQGFIFALDFGTTNGNAGSIYSYHTELSPGDSSINLYYGNNLSRVTSTTVNFTGITTVRHRVRRIGSTVYSRMWDSSLPEPNSWQITYDGSGNTNNAGVVGIFNQNGTSNRQTITIDTVTVSASPPVASFTTSTTNATAGTAITFTDTSKGTPTSWSWNFGDGGTSTSQNPSYTYALPGTYTIVLTATNTNGSDKSGQTTIMQIGTTVINSFEGNTQGTNITATSSTGNDTQFASRATNTGATITYDNSHPAQASNYGAMISYANTTAAYLVMSFPSVVGSRTTFRFWLYVPSASVSTGPRLFEVRDSSNTLIADINMASNGQIYFGWTVQQATISSTVFPLDQLVFVEGAITTSASANQGVLELAAFGASDLTTPIFSGVKSNATLGTQNAVNNFRIGSSSQSGAAFSIWYDDFQATDMLQSQGQFLGPRIPQLAIPYTETWTGTDGSSWPSQWVTKSGTTSILSNQGQFVTPATASTGYSAVLIATPQLGPSDLVFTFTPQVQAAHIIVASVDDDASGAGAAGTGYSAQITIGATAATGAIRLYSNASGTATALVASVTKTITSGTAYTVHVQRIGQILQARIWATSGSEPSTWDNNYTITGTALSGYSRIGVINGAATSRTVLFDNFIVSSPATVPVASFTANPTKGIVGTTTTFTDTSTNSPISWSWDFGDGTNSSSQNPTHTYTLPGTYTVKLIATNGAGSNSSTQSALVVIPEPGTLPILIGKAILNPGVASTGTMIISPDATISAGDWMIMTISSLQNTATVAPPPGWTILQPYTIVGTLGTAIYAKYYVAGETSYTATVSSNENTSQLTLLWGAGGDIISNWIIGANKLRGDITPTTSTNNVAPSVTTNVKNSLALIISTERTSAAESDVTSITGATEWLFVPQTGTQLETTTIAYINKSAIGATGDVTITYPNTQSINGMARQIIIPPAPITLPASEYWNYPNGSAWPSTWAQSIGTTGTPGIASNRGTLYAPASSYAVAQMDFIGIPQITDTDVYVTITGSIAGVEQQAFVLINMDMANLDGTGQSPYNMGLQINYTAAGTTSQMTLIYGNSTDSATLGSSITKSLVATTPYTVHLRRYQGLLYVRMWPASGTEPQSWDITRSLSSYTLGNGVVSLATQNGAVATSRTFNFDNLTVSDPSITGSTTLPYFQTWTGTDGANWPTEWNTLVGSSSISGNKGLLTAGNSTAYAVGRADLMTPFIVDIDVFVQVTTVNTNAEQYASVGIGADPSYDSGYGNTSNEVYVAINFSVPNTSSSIAVWQGTSQIGSNVAKTLTGAVSYNVRFRHYGATLYVRVWDASVAEPMTWDFTIADSALNGVISNGVVSLSSQNGAAATEMPILFDNMEVWPTQAMETWTGTTGAPWPAQWTLDNGGTIQATNIGQLVSPASSYGAARAMIQSFVIGPAFDMSVTISGTTNSVEQYVSIGTGYASDLSSTAAFLTGFTLQMGYNATAANSTLKLLHANIDNANAVTMSLTGTTSYRVRMQAFGNTARAKVWPITTVEPTAWSISSSSVWAQPQNGYLSLVAGSGAASTARTFMFDDFLGNGIRPINTTLPYKQTFTQGTNTSWASEWLDYGIGGNATVQAGSGQIAALNDGNYNTYGKALSQVNRPGDQQVTLDLTLTNPSAEQYNYLELRSSQSEGPTGHTQSGYYLYFTGSAAGLGVHHGTENTFVSLTSTWTTFDFTQPIHIDFRVTSLPGALLTIFLWQGSTKPAVPTMIWVDSPSYLDIATGGLMIYQSVGTATAPLLVDNLTYLSPSIVTMPYTETWTGTSGAAWPAAWTTGVSSGAGGTATIGTNTGVLNAGTSTGSWEKALLTGLLLPATSDLDLLVSFTIGSQVTSSFNIGLNCTNDQYSGNPGEMPQLGYTVNFNINATAASSSFDMWKMTGGNTYTQIYTTTTVTLSAGTKYSARFQKVGTTLQFRIWPASGSEPASWIGTATDSGTVLGGGYVQLTAGNASGQTITYDDLTIKVPVTVPYTQSWATPTNNNLWPAEFTFRGSNANPASSIASNGGGIGVLGPGNGYYLGARASLESLNLANTDVTVTMNMGSSVYMAMSIDGSGTGSGIFSMFAGPIGYTMLLDVANQAVYLYQATTDGNSVTTLASAAFSIASSTAYRTRLQRVGATVRGKAWLSSGSEPSTWLVTATVTSPMSGFVSLGVQNGNNNNNSASFDDLSIMLPSGGSMKTYNGTGFVAKPVKVWNGTSWVVRPAKRWDGSNWIIPPY